MPDDLDDVMPEGVKLREWEDSDALRENIFEGAKKAVGEQFPLSYGGVRLELHDLDYDNRDPIPLNKQKDALMSGHYLTKRLQGTYKLFDEKTGEKLDEQKGTIMRVPYLTDRGTFLNNGSEIATISQMRMLPGIYARRKESGEAEAFVNARRGSGHSFRIRLEPETGLFKLDIGQSSLRLYSLLHDIGIPDEHLEKSWGKALLDSNKQAYDRRVFEKAYQRLVRKPDPNATMEQKQKAIRDAFAQTKLDRRVVERTLPNLFNRKTAAVWRKMAAQIRLPDSVQDGAMQDTLGIVPEQDAPANEKGLTKEDLVAIAMFLNAQYDAGIPLDESLSEMADDIRALVDEKMPGLNPELAAGLGTKQALYSKGRVDRAARGSAFHHANPDPLPTLAQIRAGNYAKGHLYAHGLRISIENPKGSYRTGKDRNGKAWRSLLTMHYGYVRGAEGADGDKLDVFVGPDLNSELVFVIDQVRPDTGKFDEIKVIIGHSSPEKARDAYLQNYTPGWKGLGKLTPITMD